MIQNSSILAAPRSHETSPHHFPSFVILYHNKGIGISCCHGSANCDRLRGIRIRSELEFRAQRESGKRAAVRCSVSGSAGHQPGTNKVGCMGSWQTTKIVRCSTLHLLLIASGRQPSSNVANTRAQVGFTPANSKSRQLRVCCPIV